MRPPHQQCAVEACGISQRTALPTRRRFWQRPRIAAVGWSSQRGDSPAIRRVKTWAADGGRTDLETSVRDAAGGETSASATAPLELTVTTTSSIASVSAEEWDACATGGEEVNPFLLHSFLLALEESRSASRETGWLPQHLLARDGGGKLVGCCPAYLKGHSYGEYVFDQSWAQFARQLGFSYYPKLQACVPFTPVTGPRLLVRKGLDGPTVRGALARALRMVAEEYDVSSAHVTFNTKGEWEEMEGEGFARRAGMQYHWSNAGYATFDDFLMSLRQSRRKTIRQERKRVAKEGITCSRLSGSAITPRHWDRFYKWYLATVNKKWGTAYLTRDFFQMLGETMGERVLLVVAEEGQGPRKGELIAGALNLVGSHALFGRNWGCEPAREVPGLHFEVCYYQALEEAIARGLGRVEAGAQGEHKIQRGYLPALTYSSHYIRDPRLRTAVDAFVTRERMQLELALQEQVPLVSPFKDAGASSSGDEE